MTLQIKTFILGPLENNTYLIWDPNSNQAVVIDPSFNPGPVIDQIRQRELRLQAVWLTHAHFDHFAGASQIIHAFPDPADLLVHGKDLQLWQNGGESRVFGIKMDLSVTPGPLLYDNQTLTVGKFTFTVLPTPGHTPGHVAYHCPESKTAFCGDLIFRYSIGRTDLGGDYNTLMHSIETQILTMPPDTVLYSGHGENSTVEEQIRTNPFVTLRNRRPGFPE
ncbi:MAG: MBL fold metallo-hydrolase [Anaerolineaceae bacterium]